MDDTKNVPTTIGIIMDGNRRWAKERGLPTLKGHAAGRDTLRNCVRWANDAGVQNLICYAFSTENWNRSEDERSGLMALFEQSLRDERATLEKENLRARFIGERERFPQSIQALMNEWETQSAANTGVTVALAFSYGGRSEILRGIERLRASGSAASEAQFSDCLDTAGIPDPGIIIRTGGEKRLSGFLTWQSVYSELFFLDTLWPDFSENDFKSVLDEFAARKRNFGA